MTIPFRARPETLLSSSLAIIESVQRRTFYVCCNRRDGDQQQRDTSHGICSQGRTSLLLARQRVLDFVERRRSDLSERRAHQRFVRSAAGGSEFRNSCTSLDFVYGTCFIIEISRSTDPRSNGTVCACVCS